MDPAQRKAKILENQGLAMKELYAYVNRIQGELVPRDDLEEHLWSYAQEGLIQAIDNFDENLGHQFSSFAVATIRNALHRGYRELLGQVGGQKGHRRSADEANERVPHTASLEGMSDFLAKRGDSDDAADSIIATLSPDLVEPSFEESVLERVDDERAVETIRQVVAKMPGIEGEAFRLRLDGLTFSEIGEQLGVSRTWAAKAYEEGKDYVRFHAEAAGLA